MSVSMCDHVYKINSWRRFINSLCAPYNSTVPTCPYAKTVLSYPINTSLMIGWSVASKTSSCVENDVKTLSNLKLDLICLGPLPLITVTVLSEVLALMTGKVPCFCSRSFKGRTRTTTWTDEVAVGDVGRFPATPPTRREDDDDKEEPEEVEEKEVWSEGATIFGWWSVVYSLVDSFDGCSMIFRGFNAANSGFRPCYLTCKD